MPDRDDDSFGSYDVVIKHEEQYSTWPTKKSFPNGWRAEGRRRSKKERLYWLRDVWIDIRPLSLRKKMGKGHIVG